MGHRGQSSPNHRRSSAAHFETQNPASSAGGVTARATKPGAAAAARHTEQSSANADADADDYADANADDRDRASINAGSADAVYRGEGTSETAPRWYDE